MSMQPMIPPLTDFSVQGVSVSESVLHEGIVFVATVFYTHRDVEHEAMLSFITKSGEFRVSTQGQGISIRISDLLGSLLAKIHGGADHGSQVH